MRRLLVALLVLAAVALVLWLVFSVKDSNQLSIDISPKQPQTTDLPAIAGISDTSVLPQMAQQVTTTAVLKAPRYTGRDEKGRTWEVIAAEATQLGGADDSSIGLVSMTVNLQDPSRSLVVALTAPQGNYATASQTVVLTGGMETTVTQNGETLWLKAPDAKASLALEETEIKLTGGVTGRVETK